MCLGQHLPAYPDARLGTAPGVSGRRGIKDHISSHPLSQARPQQCFPEEMGPEALFGDSGASPQRAGAPLPSTSSLPDTWNADVEAGAQVASFDQETSQLVSQGRGSGWASRGGERENSARSARLSGVSEGVRSLFRADLEHHLTLLKPRPMVHIPHAPQAEEDGPVTSFRITKLLG